MGTWGTPYINTLRPRITIKTLDGDPLYVFNGFEASNPITVTYCDMENAIGETGTFNIEINDNNNEIAKDNLHNVKVFLELGKTSTSFKHFMIGFGDIFRVDRPATNWQSYTINGFGTKTWAYQLYISRREKYKKGESDAKVYNIIDNALTKRLWRPLKEHVESIKDITGWSRDGISNAVNTEHRVIDESFTYFGDLCDKLCDITGAVWFIDYSTGSEIFTLTYNPDLHTNINVRSTDISDRNNDDPNTSSYIKQAFGVEDNSTTEAGTATRLYTASIQDSIQIFEQDDNNGSTNTTSKAIGQQIIIDNDSRRIESIELLLSKSGDPSSPKDRLNGDIVLDDGNNKPSNQVLDEFHIGLSQIESDAKFVEVPVDISAKDLDVAQSKIWIRIFQRSNEEDENGDPDGNGNPNSGTKHTIRWRHNNVFNTLQTLYSGTSTTAGGDADLKDTFVWNTSNQGPLYACRINSNIRRLFSRTNKAAANRIRLREFFIPTDFLSEPQDVLRYLSLNLSQTSKGRRGVGEFLVTIPNNFLFRPYQWVGFADGLSGLSDTMQVQRARYVISPSEGDPQVGTLHCYLTVSGLYNTLIGACSCL